MQTEVGNNLTSIPAPEITRGTPAGRARPSLVINAFSNWVALGSNLLVGLILTPYIIAVLDTARYGIWILIMSIIGYYGLLDMGVTAAVMRYVARYAAQGEHDDLNRIIGTAITMFCIVAAFVALVSFVAADALAVFFNIETQDIHAFKRVIWLLGITAGLMFPGNVLGVIILAHERFVVANMVKIMEILLRGALSFVLLYTGAGLVGLGWVYCGVTAFAIVVRLIILKVCFPHVRIRPGRVDKVSAYALLSFGFFSLIIKIGVLLQTKIGSVIIGRYLDMPSVGIYGIAVLLFRYILQLTIASGGVTQPRLAAIAGQQESENLPHLVLRYSVFVSNLVAGIGVVAVLLCKDFLQLWLPKNVEDIYALAMVFYILLIGLAPSLMSIVSVNALEAVRKHPYCAYQTIAEVAANLVLSILLVRRFGIVGVALGTAVPVMITRLLFQPLYCCRVMKLNWFEYMAKVFVKPFLAAGLFVAVLGRGQMLFTATSYLQTALKGLVVLSLYLAFAYVFCLDGESRRMINTWLKKVEVLKRIAFSG
jgi:O-antigen/teichoic acid export membrane protein